MTLFDAIKESVTARDAAEAYNLHFGHGRRARCPWHEDSNPDLAFYDNGTCYCHACHNGGDAIALTAQIFGLSMKSAARKLNDDFRLGLDIDRPLSSAERRRIEKRRRQRDQAREKDQKKRHEWDLLCRVKHEADRQIEEIVSAADPSDWEKVWDNPDFVKALSYKARAENDLDRVWEEMAVIRHG